MNSHRVNVNGTKALPDSAPAWADRRATYWGICSCGWHSTILHSWDEAYAEADAHLVKEA